MGCIGSDSMPILALYDPDNRFNIDETTLLFCQSHATGLAEYESGGIKCDKRRLTYALCSNESGSYKLPPLIIGHAEHPRCFPRYRTSHEHGYWYFNNQNAWMKADVWLEFLFVLNKTMRAQNRHILLLCDNDVRAHKHNPADYPYVRVEYLSPNLTPPIGGKIGREFSIIVLLGKLDPGFFLMWEVPA
ncbi:hypothetical protein RSAG8_11017, partial [Rhizoctonia solani AG-8 WAC10335]